MELEDGKVRNDGYMTRDDLDMPSMKTRFCIIFDRALRACAQTRIIYHVQ